MQGNQPEGAPVAGAKKHALDGRRSLLGSAGAMTVFTLLSRILGLVREQVRGYYLGTGMASDAFGLASTIPNLFRRLFAEGAMTAAFVPAFVSRQKAGDKEDLKVFVWSFFSLFLVFMATFVAVMMLLTPSLMSFFFGKSFAAAPGKVELTSFLTVIMFPYLFLVSLASVFQGILNSSGIFWVSAFTPVLLNLCIVAAAAILGSTVMPPAQALAVGFLLGGLFQFVFQIPWLRRTGIGFRICFKWNHPGIRGLLVTFLPGVFSAGIYQINVFVAQVIAAGLEQGSIASLQYSTRLQELVLGVFVISVTTVVLPTFSRQIADRDGAAVRDTLDFALSITAVAAIPATIGLILLGEPIINLLFRFGHFDAESTRLTMRAVSFHSLGIYFIATSRLFSQVYFANKDLRTPTLISLVSMIVNIGLCLGLSRPLGNGGIALANSASAAVSAVLLLGLMERKCKVRPPYARQLAFLGKTLLACAIMILIIVSLKPYLEWHASRLTLFFSLLCCGSLAVAGFLLVMILLVGRPGRTRIAALLHKKTR